MIRNEYIDHSLGLGLGPHLAGKQIDLNGRSLEICKQLGEGGFSFVYLVRNNSTSENGVVGNTTSIPQHSTEHRTPKIALEPRRQSRRPFFHLGSQMVLKITSVHNSSQRHMAEKEAKLLQSLSHPSIVQVFDHGFLECHRSDEDFFTNGFLTSNSNKFYAPDINCNSQLNTNGNTSSLQLAQHLILMEYCEGGTAFDAIRSMEASLSSPSRPAVSSNMEISHRFDLPSLVISFGQICNAVSYLHAQRPPIIHRDLKPVNFLIKNGAYKLCDFGSAVMGHTDLRTPESRRKAEEVVNRTTTQMFRAPEMVDMYMSKKLTQSTDVWALGCCLFSLAFLSDCFEEGSNLAILSRKYKIPENNPYGPGLVELIDRMLVSDYRSRADMSEVIMCLSALYSNRPLPKRKRIGKPREGLGHGKERMGVYRTDGQGIHLKDSSGKKVVKGKKLDPKSAAAKRKKASESQTQNNNTTSVESSNLSISAPESVSSNFASFEGVFEGSLDHFHSYEGNLDPTMSAATMTVDGAFSSFFKDRCQVLVDSSLPDVCRGRSRSTRFDDGSIHVPSSDLVGAAVVSPTKICDESADAIVAPSNLPTLYGSDLTSTDASISILSGKNKRGLFGILGKSSANKS